MPKRTQHYALMLTATRMQSVAHTWTPARLRLLLCASHVLPLMREQRSQERPRPQGNKAGQHRWTPHQMQCPCFVAEPAAQCSQLAVRAEGRKLLICKCKTTEMCSAQTSHAMGTSQAEQLFSCQVALSPACHGALERHQAAADLCRPGWRPCFCCWPCCAACSRPCLQKSRQPSETC